LPAVQAQAGAGQRSDSLRRQDGGSGRITTGCSLPFSPRVTILWDQRLLPCRTATLCKADPRETSGARWRTAEIRLLHQQGIRLKTAANSTPTQRHPPTGSHLQLLGGPRGSASDGRPDGPILRGDAHYQGHDVVDVPQFGVRRSVYNQRRRGRENAGPDLAICLPVLESHNRSAASTVVRVAQFSIPPWPRLGVDRFLGPRFMCSANRRKLP